MTVSPNTIVKITSVLVVVLLVAYCFTHFWGVIPLNIPMLQVSSICAPLILTAAFIERAVEVIISPIRDSGAEILRQKLKAEQEVQPVDSVAVATATANLSYYQSITQQYASSIAFLMGLAAAICGVRALEMFVATAHPTVSNAQMDTFKIFDVFLTAALLAGGADGLHQPINAFTSFFSKSASASLSQQS